HQDAHEFLNYLLNKIVEEVEEKRKTDDSSEDLSKSVTTLQSRAPSAGSSQHHSTLVHRLFEGVLTSETRCLTCETVSSRDEAFLDLSIDIEQNSSVTACLRQFSASEMLCHKNKFFCDSCCDLQEAEKRMKIKRLPNVLALHLKRFKYQEESQRYVKLAYRVAFPFELRLFNTIDDMEDADRLYHLFGIVVHIGNGPHHGHYVSLIKTLGSWFLFDDENVTAVAESDIPRYFGDSSAGCAYVLYYQAADIEVGKLGLRPDQVEECRSITAADPPPPIRPPGVVFNKAVPIPTPSSSSSSFEAGQPTLSLQQPSILIPSAPPLPPSTSPSSGHHTFPPPPPLTSSLSSPAPPPPLKVSVSGVFNLRKPPSITVRTNVLPSSLVGSVDSTATPTGTPLIRGISLPAVPSVSIQVPDRGDEEGQTSSSSLVGQKASMSSSVGRRRPGTSWSHKYGGTPRALPIPPRPVTSGDAGSEREKEKEGGWTRWFGGGGGRTAESTTVVDSGAVDEDARFGEGESSVIGEVDSNSSAYSRGLTNGSAVTGLKKEKEGKDKSREKEKGKGAGNWFPKRKSFRIGGGGGEKLSKSTNAVDVEASVVDTKTRLRTSLQLSHRRASESGDGQLTVAPLITAVRSTPGVIQQTPASSSSKHQSLTTVDNEPHDHALINGEGQVSPTPSSDSSFEAGAPSMMSPVRPPSHYTTTTTTTTPSYHHPAAQNGHRPPMYPIPSPPVLAPHISASISTLPSAPKPKPKPKPKLNTHTPSSSSYLRTRSYPTPEPAHPSEVPPATPERKQSL
ncbi:putative ubiquitin carboxyl-terminal hydrolase creB, partial [Termitomyces sp. T112]